MRAAQPQIQSTTRHLVFRWPVPSTSIHATANAPSTPAAVPIALGDRACGGQNSSSSSMNSVGSKGSSSASSKEFLPTLSAS